MCAHVNVPSLIMLAELRREELLAQAEHYRLAKQAASLNASRSPRGTDLRADLIALRARIGAMRRRPVLTKPMDLAPTGSETAPFRTR